MSWRRQLKGQQHASGLARPRPEGSARDDRDVYKRQDYDLDNHFDRTPGMGIRFKDLSGDQLEQVRKLLKRGQAKPQKT